MWDVENTRRRRLRCCHTGLQPVRHSRGRCPTVSVRLLVESGSHVFSHLKPELRNPECGYFCRHTDRSCLFPDPVSWEPCRWTVAGFVGAPVRPVNMLCLGWEACHPALDEAAANRSRRLARRAGIFSVSSHAALFMMTSAPWKATCLVGAATHLWS